MKTEFEVLNPSHQKYQKGKLVFEFEDNGVTLKKLNFYIDKIYYFAPMTFLHGKRVSANWLFQKQYSLKALNDEELEKISQLTKDVVQTCKMEPSFQKLLNVMDKQIVLYKQLTQEKLDAKDKRRLLFEFKKANVYISKVNECRTKYLNLYSK